MATDSNLRPFIYFNASESAKEEFFTKRKFKILRAPHFELQYFTAVNSSLVSFEWLPVDHPENRIFHHRNNHPLPA